MTREEEFNQSNSAIRRLNPHHACIDALGLIADAVLPERQDLVKEMYRSLATSTRDWSAREVEDLLLKHRSNPPK